MKKLNATLPSEGYVPVFPVHLMGRHLMVGRHPLVAAHVLRRVPRHRLMMHVRVMHHLQLTTVANTNKTINTALNRQNKHQQSDFQTMKYDVARLQSYR